MMSRTFLSVATLLLLLPACSSEAPAVRSVRLEQAIEFNQRALRAFQRGEYQAAANLYDSALKLDSSIENVEGIGLNLLNLAKLNQAMGKPQVAQLYLDRLLRDKALTYPPSQLAAASAQYGLLRLQGGDVLAAKVWAEQAEKYCTSDCKLDGLLANLQANIAIQSEDAEQAVRWGERAVSANKGATQIEYANALRLLAQGRLLNQEFATALPLLEEVLVIDKTLGAPDKIRHDLLLTAQAYAKLGKPALATQFRERAARITAATSK